MKKKFELPHSSHNIHLCFLVNLGYQQRRAKDYKALVQDPKYMCKQCGRVAAKARNLCKPAKL